METHTPGPAQLLRAVGDEDTAAFAALYDVTAPQVFGMLTALFPDEQDALQAVTDTYIALWRQAPHFTFDFNIDHADEQARDRTVVAWILSVAQQAGREHQPEAEERASIARMARIASQLTELDPLTEAQALALTTVWLGGRSLPEASVELQVALPTLKSRLRDALIRCTRHYLTGQPAAGTDPLLAPGVTDTLSTGSGQTAAFSDEIATDVQVGLGSEVATLLVLQALEPAETVVVEAWMNRQDRDVTARLRARNALVSRMLTWAYRRVSVQPPASLLDSILDQLPGHQIGLLETMTPAAPDVDQQRRSRKVFVTIGAVLVLAVIIAFIVLGTADQRIRSSVDDADDVQTVQAQLDGATVTGHYSVSEDLAYLSGDEVPELTEDQVYQVWLFEEPGGQVSSVGTFTAAELADGDVQFRGVTQYELLWITAEPAGGSDTPSGTALTELPLGGSADADQG